MTFAVSYQDEGTIVDIEKTLSPGCDQLDIIMTAVADALLAAGFGDDHRLIQMQDYWAELNQTVVDDSEPLWADSEDCYPGFYASQDTVEEEQAAETTDFQVGDIVKVVGKTVFDAREVFGQIGVIKEIKCPPEWVHEQNVLVSFKSGPKAEWYCAMDDLEVIFRR